MQCCSHIIGRFLNGHPNDAPIGKAREETGLSRARVILNTYCLQPVVSNVAYVVFGLHDRAQGQFDHREMTMSFIRRGLSYTPGLGLLMFACNLHHAYCTRVFAKSAADREETRAGRLEHNLNTGGIMHVKQAYDIAKINANISIVASVGGVALAIILGSSIIIAGAATLGITSLLHHVFMKRHHFYINLNEQTVKFSDDIHKNLEDPSRKTFSEIITFFDKYAWTPGSPAYFYTGE